MFLAFKKEVKYNLRVILAGLYFKYNKPNFSGKNWYE